MQDSRQWEALNNYLDEAIQIQHKNLESIADEKELYRAQGYILSLRRLKQLKQEVLSKDG